uniref:Uncharacterized protein n=1 Tax=Arundo donax TaxID=35708 RepID=A0A0A9QZG4_ARUDO
MLSKKAADVASGGPSSSRSTACQVSLACAFAKPPSHRPRSSRQTPSPGFCHPHPLSWGDPPHGWRLPDDQHSSRAKGPPATATPTRRHEQGPARRKETKRP